MSLLLSHVTEQKPLAQAKKLRPAKLHATSVNRSYLATQPMYLAATGATDVSQRRNPSYLKLSGDATNVSRCNWRDRCISATQPKLSQVISSYPR